MVGGLAVLVPLVVLVVGGLAALVAVRRAVPSHALPVPAATARRRDARAAAAGVAVGVGVVLVLVATGVATRSVTLVLVAPLSGAAVHAACAHRHERRQPAPTGRVRSAGLAVRSVRSSAPPVLTGLGAAAAVVVLAACVAGIAVAGPITDEYVWRTATGSAGGGWFPGGALAFPVLAVAAACVGATAAVLHRVPVRPAVPDPEGWVDASLRRTSAHRVVRVSTAALVGTAGVLLVSWAHFTEAYGRVFDTTPDPVANVGSLPGPYAGWTQPLGLTGTAVVLLGLVVLAVPARGLRAPAGTVPV